MREIWVIDFEFFAPPGDRPLPVCMVAVEMNSRRRLRLWGEELRLCPFDPTRTDVLFVTFFGSAEFGCFQVLGWPLPARTIDLYVEFSAHTNGKDAPQDAAFSER